MPFTYDSDKKIVFVDYTNMKPAELIAEVGRAHDEAQSRLQGVKVKVLVDVRGTTLDAAAVKALKDSTRSSSERVEKAAVVGITGLKRILADAIAAFSGTPTKYFDTKEEALEWLERA